MNGRTNLYSFIHGRDTSINTRPPRPEKQVNLDQFLAEESDTETSDVERISSETNYIESSEQANVFLRIRPIDETREGWKYNVNENNFIVETGAYDGNSRNKDTKIEKKFTFSKILDQNVTQQQLFATAIQPLISKQENVSFLCYGTSGSGKTFTLHGTPTKPGIVPRALHHIFKELEPNIGSSPCIKLINIEPNVLTDESVRNEVQIKDLLIKRSEFTEDSQNMQTTIENECYFERTEYENEDCCYYIWVSFAEIYNENVYDLLSPDWLDDSNKENFQKKNRNLRIISNEGNAYIKNLTSIFVTNKEEAYKILQIGLTRVSNAATKINMKSTRSHCIFFVDIIKYTYTLTECTLSSYGYKFCDLAGSERANKTENEGTRFVESKNINKSLLTLGRCLSVAYERQQNKKKELVIPFRESKLTTLLQCALQGKEKITLFVNLSPISEYIDENMNVLNFSAIAKEIHTTSQPIKRGNGKRISRYSFFMASKIASPRRGISSTDLVVHELQREIGELRQQNSMLRKEMILQEMKVRKELCAAWDNDHSRLELSNTRTIENLKLRHESEIKALKEEIMELKNYIDELEGEVEIVE